jgi:hypothetical protein
VKEKQEHQPHQQSLLDVRLNTKRKEMLQLQEETRDSILILIQL